MYVDLYFTYLEINPLVVTDESIYILDLAAKVRLIFETLLFETYIHVHVFFAPGGGGIKMKKKKNRTIPSSSPMHMYDLN